MRIGMRLRLGWLRSATSTSERPVSGRVGGVGGVAGGVGELVVTSLGHAGLGLRGGGLGLLMDPWLSRRGAFLGAWHQLPSNQHLDTPGLLDVDWVTVSHEHLDHMDVGVLTRLPPTARVVINRYRSETRLSSAPLTVSSASMMRTVSPSRLDR